MRMSNLIGRRWRFILGALAIALVAAGGLHLWASRGAGKAAGIYITGDGSGYVVIERSWIPGCLRVKEGMLSFKENWGVVKTPPAFSVSFSHGQLNLEQEMRYHSPNSRSVNSFVFTSRHVLTPSGDAGRDWQLIDARWDVPTSIRKGAKFLSRAFWSDIFGSSSWDDFKKKLSKYRGDSIQLPLRANHDPMPYFLHRIDDPRLVTYMKVRLNRPSTTDDLALMRQLVADHPDDPWLRLHQIELESDHGDAEKAAGLLTQWQSAHGGIKDFLLQQAAGTARKHVIQAQVRREYPDLPGITEMFQLKPNQSMAEYRVWFKTLARMDGLLLDPRPLVIAIYDPARPTFTPVPNFLSIQVAAKAMRVTATFDLFAGRRQASLDLLSGACRLGQSMAVDGMLIHRLIGIAVQTISIDGFRILALNACETPADIRAVRQRLAWLDRAPIKGRVETLLTGEYPGIESQLDMSHFPGLPNYMEAERHAHHVDAKWRDLLAGAAAWESVLTTGNFPQSAGDFAALMDGGLPLDPFTEDRDPLRFVTTADECVVYSVGPDQTDNLTKTEYDPSNGTLSSGDVLMRVPRQREYPFPRGGVHAASADDLMRQVPTGLPVDPFGITKMQPYGILDGEGQNPVRIYSPGPSQFVDPMDISYDPTKGIVSSGNIFLELPR